MIYFLYTIFFFSAISPDAWIQTAGSLIGSLIGIIGVALGAYLGGRYASKVAMQQIEESEKRKKLELLEQQNVVLGEIRIKVSKNLSIYVKQLKEINLNRGIKKDVIKEVEGTLEELKNLSKKLSAVKTFSSFDVKIYLNSIEFEDLLDNLIEKSGKMLSLLRNEDINQESKINITIGEHIDEISQNMTEILTLSEKHLSILEEEIKEFKI